MQKIAAYGLVKNQKGETLFIQRAPNDTHPGIWELPGGGVDFGEEPKDTVKRELKEETGIDVIVEDPIKVFSTFSEDKEKHTVRIVFNCQASDVNTVTLSPDHTNYRWLLREDTQSFYDN